MKKGKISMNKSMEYSNLIKLAEEYETKSKKYLKKHDVNMAMFYNNVSKGYKIKADKLKK